MIERHLTPLLVNLASQYPVLYLTGPRQSGKTTLAKRCFPKFSYVSLEDLHEREQAIMDPKGFLGRFKGASGVILDEVQRAPDLLSYIQTEVDAERTGPYVLTGSQNFLLSERISQSLAGRASILELLPFSVAELAMRPAIELAQWVGGPPIAGVEAKSLDQVLFTGSYPRIHDKALEPGRWYDGYIRTYVERDVRTLTGIGDLDAFTRFLRLCAGRTGQLVNYSSLGSDAGVSHVTAQKWLSVLRASYILEFLPPYHTNFSKRLVKSPKMHFLDTGLLCRLLGIYDASSLATHPLRGAIFESFVVSEVRKSLLNRGIRPNLYFWRTSGGQEVDLLIESGSALVPVEVKSSSTLHSEFFRGLEQFSILSGSGAGVLVHGGDADYMRQGHQVRPWWGCS